MYIDLKKYEGYFHDGCIFVIKQHENTIEIWMESCEILPEWTEVNFPLSKRNSIAGKLILSEVKKIIVNDQPIEKLKQIHDNATILQLNIYTDYVELLILWSDYPPKERITTFERIHFYAQEIEWQNIPDLLDSFD